MMKLGGYPTHEDRGIHCPNRDVIYSKIKSLGDGTLFTKTELDLPPELLKEFDALKGSDYFHIGAGLMVGISEGRYVRMLPPWEKILSSYSKRQGVIIRPTGDRLAFRLGMKKYEPIRGERYFTTGASTSYIIGSIKLQFIAASDFTISQSRVSDRTLAVLDCFRDKDFLRDIRAWLATTPENNGTLTDIIADLKVLSEINPSPLAPTYTNHELCSCIELLTALGRAK